MNVLHIKKSRHGLKSNIQIDIAQSMGIVNIARIGMQIQTVQMSTVTKAVATPAPFIVWNSLT